jgi:hypothetical protein
MTRSARPARTEIVPSAERRAPNLLPVIAGFFLITALLTWPQVIRPTSVPDHSDPWLSMWRLAWIAHQLPRDPLNLFDGNIFWPELNTLAYSDATLLQGLLAAPALWMGLSTPAVYNLLVLGSFVFAGTAAFVLTSSLTGSKTAAAIAGIIFAFTPYRWDHYMHLELLWSGWMPLALLALHRTFESGRVRDGVAVGALVAAQTWSSIYYGVLFATVLVAVAPLMAWSSATASVRRSALALTAGALVAAVLVLPYVQPYRAAREALGERPLAETEYYGAGPWHYLASTPESVLYGQHTGPWGRHEKRLFPGLLAIGLTAIALWPPVRRTQLVYLGGLIVALDLSAGMGGILFPALREHVMPFRGLRAPARAGEIVLLLVAVSAGFGWARLERHVSLRRARRLAAAGAITMALVEYAQWPAPLRPVPVEAAPVYAWLASEGRGPVLELPLPPDGRRAHYNPEFQFQSTFHWQPIVNGYSGNTPKSYHRTAAAMRAFPSDSAIARLRAIGVRFVVLHEVLWGREPYRQAVQAAASYPSLTHRASFGEPGAEVRVYEVAGAGR